MSSYKYITSPNQFVEAGEMSTPHEHFTPHDSAIKALIIYTDFLSAAKANATLECSAKNADFSVRWNIRPWRVDLLKFPSTAEEALTEALDAHLIVFAGRHAQWLPTWLHDWLEHWAKCRWIEQAALAVFGVEQVAKLSTLATLNVQDFAKSHGLTVICDDSSVEEDVPVRPAEVKRITPSGGWQDPVVAMCSQS